VRQIHAITIAIGEDPHASRHLKRTSLALTRKLEQIIHLPIAKAPFLASVWRDFGALKKLLEKEHRKLAHFATEAETPSLGAPPVKEKAPEENFALKCKGKLVMGMV
jgi:Zn-finger nucleic acid-binding protein